MTDYVSLPFDEQIRFFRSKLNLPTKTWRDIWQGAHDRAFVVAGAIRTELLEDLRNAVDKAIAEGTTLEQFRKDFRAASARKWNYNGSEGWRSRIIYETNLRSAYAAGRYRQLTRPETLAARPYWRYVRSDLSLTPRPEHQAWDGTVLPHDDPWWRTHSPPNGWGCKCTIVAESAESLKRRSRKVSPKAPPLHMVERRVGGRMVKVPAGIDPGWDYQPGRDAWSTGQATRALRDARHQVVIDPATVRPLPEPITSKTRPGPTVNAEAARIAAVRKAIGVAPDKDERIWIIRRGSLEEAVCVNAVALGKHLHPSKTPYLPYLAETITDPQEIWLVAHRDKRSGRGTGRIRYRQLFLRRVIVPGKDGVLDKDRGLVFVAEAYHGMLSSVTFFPSKKPEKDLGKKRRGLLLWSAADEQQKNPPQDE